MRNAANTWAVVLAGGDGTRLREITTTPAGETIPKQFCSLKPSSCLLEDAIQRAQTVALAQNTCSVVAAQHRHWWTQPLKALPARNIFIQPENRGTAHGILLALLQIEMLAPNSVVVLLPADHYLVDEATMARSLRTATNLASDNRQVVYLLGAEPDGPDPELGFIVPRESRREATDVSLFVEKPTLEQARSLLSEGALWNTFILAGSLRALLGLFENRFAATVAAMRTAIKLSQTANVGPVALELLYSDLASVDFSRDVLEGRSDLLQVLRVPRCGWTDLGTRRRVEATMRTLARESSAMSALGPAGDALYWNLGSYHGRAPASRSTRAD